MAAQEVSPHCDSEESNALNLPSAADMRDYVQQRSSLEVNSEAFSSLEALSLPCSSDVEPDNSNPKTTQNDSWSSENFWLHPSLVDPTETMTEDNGLRKSLDRFYELFGHPPPNSGNPLSESVCEHLTQKILQLKNHENQSYTLQSYQLARVILSRDGCSVLQRHSKDIQFYPLGEGNMSLDAEKPTPGLSKDILRFLLQQNVMRDL